MSAEQRHSDGTPADNQHANTRFQSGSDPTIRPHSSVSTGVVNTTNSSDPTAVDPPLSSQIERTQLRMQVAALERALETSEKRRQTVIDRYEQLLAEHEASTDESPTAETQSPSPLKRLLELWQ